MNRKQRQRAATIRALQAALEASGRDEPGMAEHMYDNQIVPQERADRLRAQGEDVETALVNVDPGASGGYAVSCASCGRKARLGFKPPAGRVVLCPDCQRGGR